MESLPPSHKFATGLDARWGGTEGEDVELLRGNGSVVLRKVENQMGMNPIPIEQLEKKKKGEGEREERKEGGKGGEKQATKVGKLYANWANKVWKAVISCGRSF